MAQCLAVSGHLCILDALLLGKEAPLPIGQKSVWTPLTSMDPGETRHIYIPLVPVL